MTYMQLYRDRSLIGFYSVFDFSRAFKQPIRYTTRISVEVRHQDGISQVQSPSCLELGIILGINLIQDAESFSDTLSNLGVLFDFKFTFQIRKTSVASL